MSNPYDDFSDESYDVNDLTSIITASSHNKIQETLRRIIEGSTYAKSADSVHPSSYIVDADGFDYENCYFKGAEALFCVSKNEPSPGTIFQEHCLTNRGKRKHIYVDSSLSLGNLSDTIPGRTTIELATFDYQGNTYKEMDIGGMVEENVTIAAYSGTQYQVTFAASPDVKKISYGDMILYNDAGTFKWGQVVSYLTAYTLIVNFFSTPTTGTGKTVYALKSNVTFVNCTFKNQVFINNTYHTRFRNCTFLYDDSADFGLITSDDNTLGVGTNKLGVVYMPIIEDCLFVIRSTVMTSSPNPSSLQAFINLDRCQECSINYNSFAFEGGGTFSVSNYPVTANTGLPAGISKSGGTLIGNSIRGYTATSVAIAARFGYVGTVYSNHNVLNGTAF